MYTLWHEWVPTVPFSPIGGEAPEFTYEHGQDYVEEKRNVKRDLPRTWHTLGHVDPDAVPVAVAP